MNMPDPSRNNEHNEHEEGTGPEGTIPDTENGIGVTSTDEPSNFEPEEDEPKDDDGSTGNPA